MRIHIEAGLDLLVVHPTADEQVSLNKYVNLVADEALELWPNANLTLKVDTRTGFTVRINVTGDELDEDDCAYVASTVRGISDRVWEDSEQWVVEKDTRVQKVYRVTVRIHVRAPEGAADDVQETIQGSLDDFEWYEDKSFKVYSADATAIETVDGFIARVGERTIAAGWEEELVACCAVDQCERRGLSTRDIVVEDATGPEVLVALDDLARW